MARVLEIVMKARNEIGPAVQAVQADLQKIRGETSKLGQAFNIGVAVNVAKGAFYGLSATVAAIKGDAEKFEEAMGRLPLGLGEAWRAGRELRATLLESLDSATEIALQAKATAEAYRDSSKTNLAITKEFKAQGIEFDRQIAVLKQRDGFARDLETIRQSTAAQRLRITNRAEQGDDISKREAAALIKKVNEAEDLRVAELKRKRDEDRRKDELELQRKRQEIRERDEEERANYIFRDMIDDLKEGAKVVAGGSTGTISAGDITARFRGSAEMARSEATRLADRQAELTRETNKKIDEMIRINEVTGGAVARMVSGISPL